MKKSRFFSPFIGLSLVLFFPLSSICAEPLDVKYNRTIQDEDDYEYTSPYLKIDNQAYLEKQQNGYRQAAPIIVINKQAEYTGAFNTCRGKKNNQAGRYGCYTDDSWAVSYQSGDTTFLYVNGLRPNNCSKTVIIAGQE